MCSRIFAVLASTRCWNCAAGIGKLGPSPFSCVNAGAAKARVANVTAAKMIFERIDNVSFDRSDVSGTQCMPPFTVLYVMYAPARKAVGSKGKPYRTIVASGFEILVGRGSEDNDILPFEVAEPNDVWMHVD